MTEFLFFLKSLQRVGGGCEPIRKEKIISLPSRLPNAKHLILSRRYTEIHRLEPEWNFSVKLLRRPGRPRYQGRGFVGIR